MSEGFYCARILKANFLRLKTQLLSKLPIETFRIKSLGLVGTAPELYGGDEFVTFSVSLGWCDSFPDARTRKLTSDNFCDHIDRHHLQEVLCTN